MEKIFSSLAVGLFTVTAALAQSASPQYQTLADGGIAAVPAETDFLAKPALQARLISVNYQSDTNNAQLQISTGVSAFGITTTNQLSSSTTNQINSTNGLSAGAVLFLQQGGAAYIGTVSTWNQTTNSGPYGGTNVVLTAGGFGVATSVGDVVYQMGTPTVIGIGATTNWLNGEAIFVGNVGKPLRVLLTPALATNNLNSATVRYE
jgi:hypothetical protein